MCWKNDVLGEAEGCGGSASLTGSTEYLASLSCLSASLGCLLGGAGGRELPEESCKALPLVQEERIGAGSACCSKRELTFWQYLRRWAHIP
jgi:hypothetical protein